MLKKTWINISNIGLQSSVQSSEEKRIKFTNQLISLAISLTIIYIFIFAYWSLSKAVYIELAAVTIYISLYALIRFQYHLTARFIFISCLYSQVFILSLLLGEASQIHLLFIPAAAVPLVLIDTKNTRTLILLILLAAGTCFLLFCINFSTPFSINISPSFAVKIRVIVNLTAIISELIVIYAFIQNFERSEQKLDEKNELIRLQLQAVFENSFDALFLVDWKKRKIIKANQRAVELFGMGSVNEFYDNYGTALHKEAPTETEMNRMRYALNTSGHYENEVLYKTKNGSEFWGSLAIKVVLIGDDKYQSVRVTDITTDKKAKAQVEAALHEKEVLLAEIHHRVKNNMAVISGLLGLQSSYVEDAHAKSLFEESRNRIHSMALIHDKLYHNETFARIDFNAYCNDLIKHIASSYNASETKINFSISCKDVFIDIKNAVPCGLILNELIANAYKHAFKNKETGEIKIVCTKMGGKITMMMSDDGIGFNGAKNIEKPQTLGLTLITALVQQVNGSIKVVNKNGTTYYISFEE